MRLQVIIEAAILAIFLAAALVIMYGNKIMSNGMEASADAGEYVQRGNHLYSLGRAKFNEASIQYWEAIKLNPHISEAHLKLASIYSEYIWNYEALRELGEVERIDPNNPGLYLLEGEVYDRMGEADKALESFRRAATLQPGNSEAHYYLGTIYQQQGMEEEAIGEYEKAIEGISTDSEVILKSHLQLGRIYKDKQRERAKTELKAALDIDPKSAEVISELRALYRREAEDYENRDEYDKAAEKYKEMMEIDPESSRNVEIYMQLGDIYRNKELYDEAKTMYEAAAKLDPLNFDAFSALKELELLRETGSEGE